MAMLHRRGTHQNQNSDPGDSNSRLVRWMREQQQVTSGPWDLYQSRNFADLWYGARAAGEHIRAITLERLYRHGAQPGGAHPDPREPAAFSSQAILTTAAAVLGLRINPQWIQSVSSASSVGSVGSDSKGNLGNDAQQPTAQSVADIDEETGDPLPLAWIVIYPAISKGKHTPGITVRSLELPRRAVEHEIACLLGFWHHEYQRLNDPDAPAGSIPLPHDAGVTALLHQYAIALLCLPRDCPASWHCQCNDIRARFNAPPPGHEVPTDVYNLADLALLEQEIERHRRDSGPRFPYTDKDRWTE